MLKLCLNMQDLISMLNDHELELLISGLPEIDVGDLRANTEYAGYTAASTVIQWFWEVVADMDKEDLALLVQFVTGTSKVPLDGFKALQVSWGLVSSVLSVVVTMHQWFAIRTLHHGNRSSN